MDKKLIKVPFDYYGENKEELNKITYLELESGNYYHYVVELTELFAEIILNENFEQIKIIVRRLKLDKLYNNIETENKDEIFLEFFLREYDKIKIIG